MNTRDARHIVGIHGAPRSGTTWLGQLFNASEHVAYRYQPMFSYAFKGRICIDSDAEEITRFFSDLLRTQDDFVLQKGDASLAGYELSFPKLNITHLVYKEVRYHHLIAHILDLKPNFSAVGLVRDPRAVIHSWSKAPREFNSSWMLAEEWRDATRKNRDHSENWYGFERWKELTLIFHRLRNEYPRRFNIVRYEDLCADPIGVLSRLFDSFCLPWTPQAQFFLQESMSREDGSAYGVFRDSGTVRNGWAANLPEEINEAILGNLKDGPLEQYLSESG